MGCARCGDTFDLEEQLDLDEMRFARRGSVHGILCRGCRLAPPAYVRAVSWGAYLDELRELIHLLKFERVASVAPLLGRRLAEAILTLESETAGELLVVAVPLFAARERQRGFNQSVLLADAALKELRRVRPEWRMARAHGALRRQRRTESQFALALRDRRRNLDGAFVAGPAVRAREVLLVDDIMTSGATARACSKALIAAGAAKVWVATVARALGDQARQRQRHDTATASWDLVVPAGRGTAETATPLLT